MKSDGLNVGGWAEVLPQSLRFVADVREARTKEKSASLVGMTEEE